MFLLISLAVVESVAACLAPYAQPAFEHDLGVADAALQAGDPEQAAEVLSGVLANLECADGLVDRPNLVRFARLSGLVAFFDQDEPGALRWALAARYADAQLEWPTWIPAEHPFRGLATAADDPPVGTVADKALLVPKRGGVFWNGQLLLEPRARAEVPGLVQIIDSKERPIRSYWQDGAAFPDELLVPGPAVQLRAPPWWEGDVPEVAEVREKGGGAPVGAIVAAVASALAGGALYGVAAVTAGGLGEATSAEDAASMRTRANALVVAAGAAGVTALGATIGAVAAEGVGVGVRVRF